MVLSWASPTVEKTESSMVGTKVVSWDDETAVLKASGAVVLTDAKTASRSVVVLAA